MEENGNKEEDHRKKKKGKKQKYKQPQKAEESPKEPSNGKYSEPKVEEVGAREPQNPEIPPKSTNTNTKSKNMDSWVYMNMNTNTNINKSKGRGNHYIERPNSGPHNNRGTGKMQYRKKSSNLQAQGKYIKTEGNQINQMSTQMSTSGITPTPTPIEETKTEDTGEVISSWEEDIVLEVANTSGSRSIISDTPKTKRSRGKNNNNNKQKSKTSKSKIEHINAPNAESPEEIQMEVICTPQDASLINKSTIYTEKPHQTLEENKSSVEDSPQEIIIDISGARSENILPSTPNTLLEENVCSAVTTVPTLAFDMEQEYKKVYIYIYIYIEIK